MPGVDPRHRPAGDVRCGATGSVERLHRTTAAGAGLADDEDVALRHLLPAVAELAERDEHRTGHVPGDVLVGVADVEDVRARGMAPGELLDIDLGYLRFR